jgi:chitinase
MVGNRASVSSTTPQSPPPDAHPKGGITLTPNTIIKRSKTLFGSSIIEIKSEYDSITLCAYNSGDDSAWFSELYHALERVKKVYRDENSNGQSSTLPPSS